MLLTAYANSVRELGCRHRRKALELGPTSPLIDSSLIAISLRNRGMCKLYRIAERLSLKPLP